MLSCWGGFIWNRLSWCLVSYLGKRTNVVEQIIWTGSWRVPVDALRHEVADMSP